MSRNRTSLDDLTRPTPDKRGARRLMLFVLPTFLLLVLLTWAWFSFFHYVPPRMLLVVVAKNGADLPAGQVLADPGQKGVQRAVLGEGWHYVTPVLFDVELKDNVVIEPGKVGVMTQLGGKPPAEGQILVDGDDEQGIRRQVLPPGTYRLNPYGVKVEQVPVVEVGAGHVGVVRRLLGKDGPSRFAEADEQKGILREVLQPGSYYLNPKEYEVIPYEVGIYQTSLHHNADPVKNTEISFHARDGNLIRMDATIEWEVPPRYMPELVAAFGERGNVEYNVVVLQAQKISQNRGSNYRAEDFLEGDKREGFQNDFIAELNKVCEKQKVIVRSAFIRNIVIPESVLKQKRDRQLAIETTTTSEAKEATAQSDAEVARAQALIPQAEAEVKAETARLVAGVNQEKQNLTVQTDAEIKELQSDYKSQKAQLEAEKTRVLGEAKASVARMKNTAEGGIHKMKLEAFQNDGDAYLRATLADKLNPDVVLRLFQSGAGTFWTNLDNKNMTLMLPAAGAPAPAKSTDAKTGSEK